MPKNRNTAQSHSNVSQKSDMATSIWNVKEFNSLRDVATIVPLEKTHISVSGLLPNEVANRILDSLRRLSISSIFRRPKATLLAESLDHTQFYIRLFKKIDGANRAIVVELQRRNGCSLTFVSMARTILREVKHGYIDEESTSNMYVATHDKNIITATDDRTHKEMEEDMTFALELVADNLVENCFINANLIAMESLCALLDGWSTDSRISLAAANNILRGDDGTHQEIKRSILQYVCHPCHEKYFHNELEERHCLVMHNLALAALANMLQIFPESGNELQVIVKSDEWLGDKGLLAVLIEELHFAETRPHDAYHAMRCLNAIIGVSSDVKSRAIELGIRNAMDISQNVGHCSHALLARESDIGISMV